MSEFRYSLQTGAGGIFQYNNIPKLGTTPLPGQIPVGWRVKDLEQTPGNLGQRGISFGRKVLITQSLRSGSSNLHTFPINSRYKGPKISSAFNLMLQSVLLAGAYGFQTLEPLYRSLKTTEELVYPLDSEIQLSYFIAEQLRFKQWVLVKDSDYRWFV